MSDPAAAQAKADESQKTADSSAAAAKDAEARRDAAVRAASLPGATQAQHDVATRLTDEAAAAREAANANQKQANDDQAEALKASIAVAKEKVVEAAHAAEHKAHGFYLFTDLNFDTDTGQDWKAMITQNMQIKCVGPESKKVLGFTLDGILGAKTEICTMGKFVMICPAEHKFVGGTTRSTIAGIKHDFIGGAKWDQVVGVKRETHIGHKAKAGPAETMKYPERVGTVGRLMTKGLSWLHVTKDMKVNAVNLSEDIDSRRATIKSLEKQIKRRTSDIKMWNIKADRYTLRGRQITLAYKDAQYHGTSTVAMKGGSGKIDIGSGVKMAHGGSKVELWSSLMFVDGEIVRLN